MRIMIKLAGMFCVMAAAVLTGIGLEGRAKKRWQLFLEMRETLAFLIKEMTYHRSPVCEAFRSAAERCRTELGTVLSETAAQAERRSGQTFTAIWEEALARHLPDGLLTDEEGQLFDEVSAALCNTDVVMQKTLLEKYEDRFRLMSEAEAQVFHEKSGLYRKLAAAAGVFLVILLF